MAGFRALALGRRQIRCRILAVYHADARVVLPLLPKGCEARLCAGRAVIVACYTRLGAARLLRGRTVESDHLAYRVAIERPEKEARREGTWIVRRETSSWLEARCGAKLLRGEYERATFQLREGPFGVELAVQGEDVGGESFYLRAEASANSRGALFPTAAALEEFLGHQGDVRPLDVFAPEADGIDPDASFVPEPLAVFEERSAFLGDTRLFPPHSVVLDGAWRLVTRRLAFAHEPSPRLRALLVRGQSSPAV